MSRPNHARARIHALLDAGVTDLKAICACGFTECVARNYRTEWRKLRGLGRIERPPVRRQQVIELDALGLNDREIAAKMGITPGAVSAHRHLAGLAPRMFERRGGKSPGALGKTWTREAVKVPDLGRCACGLLLPCTCDGKQRSAVAYLGRRGEQVIGSAGL
jgi:hypothetical protein